MLRLRATKTSLYKLVKEYEPLPLIELNNDYFRDAVGYLKEFEAKEETISLFDMIG